MVAGQVGLIWRRRTGGGGCCCSCWLEIFQPALCLFRLSRSFLFCKHFIHDLLVEENIKIINSPSFDQHLPNFILCTHASGCEGLIEGEVCLLWVFIGGYLLRNPLAACDGLIIDNVVLLFLKGEFVQVFAEVMEILVDHHWVAAGVNCWRLKPGEKGLFVPFTSPLLLFDHNLIFVNSLLVRSLLKTNLDVLQLCLDCGGLSRVVDLRSVERGSWWE